jgi:hypothetical protein
MPDNGLANDYDYSLEKARYLRHQEEQGVAALKKIADEAAPPMQGIRREIFGRMTHADPLPGVHCEIVFGSGAVASRDPYDRRASELADKCQQLTDDNRSLLVENAQLRREVERLQRKAKK